MRWNLVIAGVLLVGSTGLQAQAPAVRWVKSFGGTGCEFLKAMAVDDRGGLHLAGESRNSGSIGKLVLSGHATFAARLDFSGEVIWATQLGAFGVRIVDLAIDASGMTYILCAASGTNMIGGIQVECPGQETSGIIVILDRDGVTRNAFVLKGDEEFEPFALKVDPTGHCYWSGYCHGYVDAGEIKTTSRTIIGKLSPNREHLWHHTIKATKRSYATIDVDPLGNVYVMGDTAGGAQLEGLGISGALRPNGFLAKLDSTGHPIWVRHFVVTAKFGVVELAVDPQGACIVFGHAQGRAIFEDHGIGSPRDQRWYYFAAKYLSDGGVAWARQTGFTQDVKPGDVNVDRAGNVYLAQTFDASKASISKLGPAGELLWEKRYSFEGPTGNRSFMNLTSEGFIYLARDFYARAFVDGATMTCRGQSDFFVALLEGTTSPWESSPSSSPARAMSSAASYSPDGGSTASNAIVIPTSRGRMYFTK
jgi:hypothetical protein